jgi:predicted alpha-1,6-mannanase (GH76 family)
VLKVTVKSKVAKVSTRDLIPGWGNRLRRIYKHVYHYVMPAEELEGFVDAAMRVRREARREGDRRSVRAR